MSENETPDKTPLSGYSRFFAMIATSTVIMFGLMYLNSYEIIDHAKWSEARPGQAETSSRF